MTCSILSSIKKVLGIEVEYKIFDPDIIIYINIALSNLNQLGVGPKEGYSIGNEADEWSDFIGSDSNLNLVKSYIITSVKLMFDPPITSFAIDALKKQLEETTWRLSVISSTSPDSKEHYHGA